jgi:hypothetical protein
MNKSSVDNHQDGVWIQAIDFLTTASRSCPLVGLSSAQAGAERGNMLCVNLVRIVTRMDRSFVSPSSISTTVILPSVVRYVPI